MVAVAVTAIDAAFASNFFGFSLLSLCLMLDDRAVCHSFCFHLMKNFHFQTKQNRTEPNWIELKKSKWFGLWCTVPFTVQNVQRIAMFVSRYTTYLCTTQRYICMYGILCRRDLFCIFQVRWVCLCVHVCDAIFLLLILRSSKPFGRLSMLHHTYTHTHRHTLFTW